MWADLLITGKDDFYNPYLCESSCKNCFQYYKVLWTRSCSVALLSWKSASISGPYPLASSHCFGCHSQPLFLRKICQSTLKFSWILPPPTWFHHQNSKEGVRVRTRHLCNRGSNFHCKRNPAFCPILEPFLSLVWQKGSKRLLPVISYSVVDKLYCWGIRDVFSIF